MESAKPCLKPGAGAGAGVELWMSWVLRGGVFLCGTCIAVGWVFMMIRAQPQSVAVSDQGPSEVLQRLLGGDWAAMVPLGIRLLLLLPVLRVALSLVLFLERRDWVYVGLSATVLLILAGSVFYGLSSAG